MNRWWSSLLGWLFLGLVAVACGTPVAPTPSALATATARSPAAPTATSTPEPPTAFRVWVPPAFDPQAETPAAEALRARLEAFAAGQGLPLDVRVKALEGPGSMLAVLADAELVAPEAVPQAVLLPRAALERAALKGLLTPLQAVPEAPLPLAQADTFPYASALAQVQGVTYGVPAGGSALALFYPPQAFAEGLPADWQALVAVEGLPWRWAAGDPYARLLLGIYRSAGGALRSEEGRPGLDEAVLTRVLHDIADLTGRGLVATSLLDLTSDEAVWKFYGQSPSGLLFVPQAYLVQAPAAWRVALIPGVNGQGWAWADGYLWAVPLQSASRLTLASRWLREVSDPAFVGTWTEAQGLLPPTEAALQAWQQAGLAAQMQPFAQRAQILPPLDVLTTLGPPLQQALAQVITGAASPEEAAHQAVQALAGP